VLRAEWQKIVIAVGDSVKEARTLLGWSQAQLADRAVTSQGTISRIESGNHDNVPFHSIVIVFRTLAVGLENMSLTVSPTARSLMSFVQDLNPEFTVVAPVDQSLVDLIHMYHGLNRAGQEAFVRFACTVRPGG
jgi:transcriptional regulator with XRE-family HTH domain